MFEKLFRSSPEKRREKIDRKEEVYRASAENQKRADELSQRLDETERLARMDALTGIMNRRGFEEAAKRVLERPIEERRANESDAGRTHAVIMFDVDHFKKVNDTYGHTGGDLVLKKIGEMLRGETRAYDCVGRYGGEEFIVLVETSGMPFVEAAAERLRVKLNSLKVRLDDGRDVEFSISMGIAEVHEGESIDSARERADQALYQAKGSGRNRVIVDGSSASGAEGESR